MKEKCLSALALMLALAMTLAGCTAEQLEKQSAVGLYLDTVIMLTAYVDDVQVLNDALEECGRYERMLSRTIEGSDVWRINHAKGAAVEVSDETVEILQAARQVSELLRRCIEGIVTLSVPLRTDISIGGDWRACK